MEKPVKLILTGILVLAVIQLALSFINPNPRLRESLEKLNDAEQNLNVALKEVETSRATIDSMQLNMLKFNNYLIAIQSQVGVLYQDRLLREAKFKNERDSIVAEVKRLKLQLDTINLPTLKIYDNRE